MLVDTAAADRNRRPGSCSVFCFSSLVILIIRSPIIPIIILKAS